jgi:hypothetical protein
MTPRSTRMTLLGAMLMAGCQCPNADIVEIDSNVSSSASGEVVTGSSTSTDASTGEPFDASRWAGRYHFEHVFVPFGEPSDTLGADALVNFEILPDGRATMFYDKCFFEQPVTIAYEWLPSEDDGWLTLHPGEGESSLRFLDNQDVGILRVQLVEPCRELNFEIDGRPPGFTIVRPGESCWVDRCTVYHVMQVDYCEGEEPPPCP